MYAKRSLAYAGFQRGSRGDQKNVQVLCKTPRIWDYKSTRGKGRGRGQNNVRRGRGSQEERGRGVGGYMGRGVHGEEGQWW